MKQKIIENGGKVILNTSVSGVAFDGKIANGIILGNDEKIDYDYIISTMPLTTMVKSLNCKNDKVLTACENLIFRNTIIVYLEVNKLNLFPDQWLYVHSSNIKTGRITNFRNWSTSLLKNDQTSIIAMEYWCYDNDVIWNLTENKLIEMSSSELLISGIIDSNIKINNGKVIKINKSYPVYNSGYKEHLSIVIDFLNQIPNLIPIGRYGSFKYNNQDHSILMGILLAENIIKNKNHDLWSINTDYEYQESSKITATGLQY